MSRLTVLAPMVLAAVILSWTNSVFADPPAHAKAHGWRKKHDPYYVGYTGRHWERDYQILSGRCNREEVATVLGGIVGGVVGYNVADHEDRAVATIIGAAAGALIGNAIGRRMDAADQACVGHALEVGKTGQNVQWTNEDTGVDYEMKLLGDKKYDGVACREFSLTALSGADRSSRQGVACQNQPGNWEMRSQ